MSQIVNRTGNNRASVLCSVLCSVLSPVLSCITLALLSFCFAADLRAAEGDAAAIRAANVAAQPIRIASKNFTESYLLSEISAQLLEARGFEVRRQFGLGGTLICYEALVNEQIDVYIEYTGTIAQAILESADTLSLPQIRDALPLELELLLPFGFNNTYALAMRAEHAQSLQLRTITDLVAVPDLKVVVSHEFLERNDGWPGLKEVYGFNSTPAGIEHGLAYQALAQGAIDVTDAYSTDGELARYDLKVLEDDAGFFPQYLALPFVRKALPEAAKAVLRELADSLDAEQMQALNSLVLEGSDAGSADFAGIAQKFLLQRQLISSDPTESAHDRMWSGLWSNTLRHLQLTLIALCCAVFVGVGAGLLVFRNTTVASAVLYLCGLLQTIPSIALLALMIPLLGIGMLPAIVALFLYALLPILRNTIVALGTIDPELVRTAKAIGLSRSERMRHVLVPLALPNIFAGIRTAAVISVGTATLAALIGAGGLGDPILTGLSLNDTHLILQGAVPAALLAMGIELGFELLERLVIPKPLRDAARGGG